MEDVLFNGSFKIKRWVITGDDDQSVMNGNHGNCEKILGLNCKCYNNVFCFRTKINFSPKFRGERTGPDFNKLNFFDNIPSLLTKRIAVGQLCSVYDPLLLSFTFRAKMLLRDTVKCESKLGWDDPLPPYLKEQWMSHFHNLFGIETLHFELSVKSPDAKGLPMLVTLSDASTDSYGSVAYTKWELDSGGYGSRLIMAKSRIAPTRQLSIPRLELCAAVTACRIRKTIEDEMRYY